MTPNTLQTLLDRRAAFLKFVERRVGDRALAEDILQAAYMRALQSDDRPAAPIGAESSATAWFYTVLRNAVIDHYRRHTAEHSAMERWQKELDTLAPKPVTREFVCACIEHVLPSLRPAYAEVLREVDLAEEPLANFAQRHALTPGNAATRAHRARAALKRELAEFCGACSTHACLRCDCIATRQWGI